jgi:hypothetical protein
MNNPEALSLLNLATKYRIDLVQVGDIYQARCPFHEDSTPSFTIYPEENKFYCFGCKVAGGPRRFLELKDPAALKNIDFNVWEMQDKLSKYRLEVRNMKKMVLLVSSNIINKALKLRGILAIEHILYAFDEQMETTEHISMEESRRILDNLEKFLFSS